MKAKSLAIFLSLLLFVWCLSSCGTISDNASSDYAVDHTIPTEQMVWIPTRGGIKYHKTSSCSNMNNPSQVTISRAKSLGFTPCKRCYG